MGFVYLLSPQFMSYHAEAIGVGWHGLEPSFQVLFLALLKVSGAGFVGVGVALGVLLFLPFRRRERWAHWAIPAVGLAFWVPTLYATVTVTLKTPASAPWQGNLASVMSLIVGFILSLRARSSLGEGL